LYSFLQIAGSAQTYSDPSLAYLEKYLTPGLVEKTYGFKIGALIVKRNKAHRHWWFYCVVERVGLSVSDVIEVAIKAIILETEF